MIFLGGGRGRGVDFEEDICLQCRFFNAVAEWKSTTEPLNPRL